MRLLALVVAHELRMLSRNKKVLLGHSVGIFILWSLLVANIRDGAREPLTGYFLLLLLAVAVGVPSSVGVHAFVGEKERRTMEPLLLLPISMRALIGGKFLTIVMVSLAEFAVVCIAGVAAAKLVAQPDQYRFVISPLTQYVAVVVAPLFIMLFTLIAIIVSGRSSNTQSALSVMAFIAVPVAIVLLGMMLGALSVSEWAALAATGILVLANLVAYRIALSAVTTEALVERRA